MVKKKVRKRSGKITAWQIPVRCIFTKENEAVKYIESCVMVAHTSKASKARDSDELHNAIKDWADELIEANGYDEKCNLQIDRWLPVRS
ncbi:hypothetical protein L3V82_08370 [Thiotrichales bacterium 19S3-7]|nr:hypothetical protein [Thiotrichales bacterium 19S3-7]MCF6802270.1 hypothetical protein [Thiotrichales bacterium 19S3-11]